MKRSTATMNYIPTHLIDPNPHRDFTINPIRVDNIETLVGSFQRNTQMDALVVRKHPTEPGRYQLSAGHHRLFAMGGLKGTPTAGPAPEVLDLPEVRVLIKDMTDDQMLTWMADENANQSGATPSNDMDSVKGVVTRIAYLMISGADEPEWVSSGIPEKTSDTGGAPPWSRACAEFNSGKGIGSPLILRFPGMQSLKRTRIESALASLKAMQEHGYADAISTAQALYQADLDAEYEAEQIRIRDAEEAKKRAQEA